MRQQIVSTIPDSIFQKIKGKEMVKEAWELLKAFSWNVTKAAFGDDLSEEDFSAMPLGSLPNLSLRIVRHPECVGQKISFLNSITTRWFS